MGIGGGSVLVPWRPAFWNAAEVVCVCVYLSKALPPLNPHPRAPQTTPMQPPPGLLALAGGGEDARAAWRYRKMKKTEREMAPACSRSLRPGELHSHPRTAVWSTL